jgi:hypothetical protein
MRLPLLLLLATACSNNNPTPDGGGTDAAADIVQTQDSASDAPPSDGGSCNVSSSSALVTGTFLGKAFSPQDSVAFEAHTTQYEVVVGLTDFKGECALGNDVKANSNVVAFIYQAATPLVPATIDIAQTNVLFAQYTQFDGTCQSPAGESASSGTITFTRADDCAVEGSFDLMFNTDHVTGSFTSPVCANTPDGGASACK